MNASAEDWTEKKDSKMGMDFEFEMNRKYLVDRTAYDEALMNKMDIGRLVEEVEMMVTKGNRKKNAKNDKHF